MRKIAFATVLGAALLAIPLTVLAARSSLSSKLDHQTGVVRSGRVSTSSSAWRATPGLHLTVCARNEVSATLSVTVAGAPVRFRVLSDNVPTVSPSRVLFDPTRRQRSFSFTFLARTGTFEGSDAHSFGVQWRSPTGKAVRLYGGTFNLVYHRGGGSTPTGPC